MTNSFSSIDVGDTIKWNSVEHAVIAKANSQIVLANKNPNDEVRLDKETVNDFFTSDAIQFDVI